MKTYIAEVRQNKNTDTEEIRTSYILCISRNKKKLTKRCKEYAKALGYEKINIKESNIGTVINGHKNRITEFIHIWITEIKEI